jgi:NAD(P)-dependent dehydrogenase (short-subunit alcohol dehydrogenase family)
MNTKDPREIYQKPPYSARQQPPPEKVSFTRSLASLAIKQGVRVNAVAPGPVWTPLIPSTLPKEKIKEFGAQTVFGRAAQPAEIAPIFVFLDSDQASYVAGEVYGATGGQMPM